MSPILGTALCVLSACAGAGGLMPGTYFGYLADGDLDPWVTIDDEDSSFTLMLDPTEDGANGRATLVGKTHGPVGKFDGKEVDEIPDVGVSGRALSYALDRSGYDVAVTGTFAEDFTALDLHVQYIGTLFLDRIEVP